MLFAADLDNTLLHSYKIARAGDVCVAAVDGRELSFMTREAFGLLREVAARCLFVPITTRSLAQYRQLELGVKPAYALVSNGALLLLDGKVDEAWMLESRSMFPAALPQLSACAFLHDVRMVDGFFIFAKAAEPEQAVLRLRDMLAGAPFSVHSVHEKVYVFPAGMGKGTALARLKARLRAEGRWPVETVVCAGDSALDIPMLEMADTAIAPASLGLAHRDFRALGGEPLGYAVLDTVLGL